MGSLIVTVSICALAEMARPIRFLNIPLATVLLITPFVFGVGGVSIAVTLITAIALIILSLPRGPVYSKFGHWNRYLV